MNLRGQAGYLMAALLVAMTIMAIVLTVAMPVWKTTVKREKEAELIWRGQQYARAVNLFRRKYANAYPPNIDILLNERFLRKKYKDPMTKDGEFRLLYAAQQNQTPGSPQTPGVGNAPGQVSAPVVPLDQPAQGPAGAAGGIMGVASKSSETGMRLFNGRSKYSEWAFTAQTTPTAGGPGGPAAGPGSQRPGPGGPGGPGQGTSRPGPGGAPRMNFPGFGVQQPGQPPNRPRPRPPD